MPRTKRKLDSDEADPDFRPQPGFADNDDFDDDSSSKSTPKRNRRSTNGSTTSRISTSAKAKAAAQVPYEPHPIDDPFPETPASVSHLHPPSGNPSSYGTAEQQPFPWQVPITVPEWATNWWQMVQLDPDNPDSTALLLENVTFSSSTLLAFPDPALLDPATSSFVGPSDFSFFQVPYLIREPLLQAKRPKLQPDGVQCSDYRGNLIYEPHTYSLPADARAPLLKREFDGTGDNYTVYSDAFNKFLRQDEHLERYKDKNKNHFLFPGGSTPLAFLREVTFVPQAHFVRPATVAVMCEEKPPQDPTPHAFFEVLHAESIGLQLSAAMEEYVAILVRPHQKECYTTHEQMETSAPEQEFSDSQETPATFVELKERTSWQYVASVYLRRDKLQAVLQGSYKAQAQKDIHELLKVFTQSRHTSREQAAETPPDLSLGSPTDFANRARQLEISPDTILTFSRRQHAISIGHIVQLGPHGPYYDSMHGLFASHYTALSGEPTLRGRHGSNHVIHFSRSSGLVCQPVFDSSASNLQRMLNALHLIAAQPCTRPEPIPMAYHPRLPSRATLVVTAGACIAHWESLAREVLGPTASIVTLSSTSSLSATPLRNILLADIVIVSDNVLLQPTAWTRRTTFPKDFTLTNVNPNKLLLPDSQQEYIYYGNQDGSQAYVKFIRQDVPARRMELVTTCGTSGDGMFESAATLISDMTVAYWHRIVVDHWDEVSSLHSLLAGRAWIVLGDSQECGKVTGFKEGGVFVDQAHQLRVATDVAQVPLEPVVECTCETVYTAPLDLALQAIHQTMTSRNEPWQKLCTAIRGMRTTDDYRGYPYLVTSSFPKWKLSQVADALAQVGEDLHKQQQATAVRVQEAIRELHTLAKRLKAVEIALLVLNRDLQRHLEEGNKDIKEMLSGMADHMSKVKHNDHIDMARYSLRVSYDRYAYRPITRNDIGATLYPEELRELDSAIQVVCAHVRSLCKGRDNFDLCEGALRLVRNTTLAEGWMAKIVHQGGTEANGQITCPSCEAVLAKDDKLTVTPNSDYASCSNCPPAVRKSNYQDFKYEFLPVPSIRRSRDWLAQLAEAEKRGENRKIWPRAFIQTLVLRAHRVLSSNGVDGDGGQLLAHSVSEAKRIVIFLSAEHIKSAAKCFTLLNLPYVTVDSKQVYKSLKVLYATRSNANTSSPTDDGNAQGDADDSSSIHNEAANNTSSPEHVSIVLVDSMFPRMARLRIPGVTHVFLASGWRSKGPCNCVSTALRPPNEEQQSIQVVSFVGDSLCETIPVDDGSIRMPSRSSE